MQPPAEHGLRLQAVAAPGAVLTDMTDSFMSGTDVQVLAAVDKVAEQLQASGKAKTAAMQDYAIKCYTEILTPLQARL